MTDSKKKNSATIWGVIAIVVPIITLIGVGCYLLMRGTETRESNNNDSYSISALICEADSPIEAFFLTDVESSTLHTIKVTIKDDKPDKISYTYVGKFETEAIADKVESSFHANYNIDMGENGLDPESLTPSFAAVEKAVKINLYTTVDALNSTTEKFFFLTTGERRNIKNSSEKDIQKIYENVGFSCKHSE